MKRWLKSPLGIGIVVTTVAIVAVFFGPLDYAQRYLHFSNLTKDRVVQGAEDYIQSRVPGSQMACLYVVQCDDEGARLEIVTNIESWDFNAAKRTIWERRFGDYCAGQTANLAIHLVPHEDSEAISRSTARAVWSFFNDRFIPVQTRFGPSAFSERTWEPCTAEFAIAGKEA